MFPDWLPAQLSFPGSNVQIDYQKLHEVYRRDFVDSPPISLGGGIVLVDTGIDPNNPSYTRGFTHLITRGDDSRSIDYERASKLPWIRAVLENYTQPEVSAFWHMSPKGKQVYFWMPDYNFTVILRPLRGAKEQDNKIIVTAFSIDRDKNYQMQRRFGNALEILE